MARNKPYRPPTSITLAGIPVRRELVGWLAAQLEDDPAGDRLRSALDNDTRILGLEVAERETILRVLEDPPAGLEELRGVLLEEHVARKRDGLV
jgi:hypothetical protein